MRVDPTNHPHYDAIIAVSAAVLTAERDVDTSILTLSKLMATTIEHFAEAQLPAQLAQPALGKLVEALSANVEGRRLLGEAHREYGRTAKVLGAAADDWGPVWPCPGITTDDARRARPALKVAA